MALRRKAVAKPEPTAPPEVPPNIEEFSIIAGLIFAQLYRAFPERVPRIDSEEIARVMGIGADYTATLKSGRRFADMLGNTIAWLEDEHYIRAFDGMSGERECLTDKGLAAMNAAPFGRKTLGTELAEAASAGSSTGLANQIAELMGSFSGGLLKSYTSPGCRHHPAARSGTTSAGARVSASVSSRSHSATACRIGSNNVAR
jgi:hypothetical protein